MLKKLITIIIILAALITAYSFYKGTPQWALAHLGPIKDREALIDGERLELEVSYLNLLPVARLNLNLEGKGASNFELRAHAETLPYISKLYRAEARVTSFVKVFPMQPLKYTEELKVTGEDPSFKEIKYNHSDLIMEAEGKKRKILHDTQDPVSLIYYLRTVKLAPHEKFNINLNTNQENYFVRLEIVGEETVRSVPLWKIEGKFGRADAAEHARHTGTFTIWMSKDNVRLPVLLKAATPAGVISARLISSKP